MEYKVIKFEFTEEERLLAAKEGYRRHYANRENGIEGRNGGPTYGNDAIKIDLIGAAGEMAVASYLGLKEHLYKDKTPIRGSVDLPPNIDVKTRSKHYYDLIVQFDDDPSKIFILVTIENKECLIHGWIEGEMAMKYYNRSDPAGGRPAYFVIKSLLKPINELDLGQ